MGMLRVGVAGALGRLGRVACTAVEAADDLTLSAAFARRGGARVDGVVTDDDLDAFLAHGLDVVGAGGDGLLTINFPNVGQKMVMLKYAPLEKV